MPFHNSNSARGGVEQKDESGETDLTDDCPEGGIEEEEGEEAKSWLEDLGVETSQFPNLSASRIKL